MQNILFLHIVGAILTGGIVIAAWVGIARRKTAPRIPHLLLWFTIFEIATGTMLATSSGSSVLLFCKQLGAYLGITTITGIALHLRKNQKTQALRFAGTNLGLAIVATLIVLLS